nr:zinc finger, CCHC-type [Tanacetum cinerariifolium]
MPELMEDDTVEAIRMLNLLMSCEIHSNLKYMTEDASNRGGEYYDPVFFQSAGVIHETTAPYTPQQNDPRTYNEAMQSCDAVICKEAINDKIAIHNLVIHQMDVKTAFLNGDLDEEVYMKQPKGFVMPVLDEGYGRSRRFLGIKIKRENKGIVYIEKILKKFNREDCSSVITPMDPIEKLKPNTRKAMDQLEYSRVIRSLVLVSDGRLKFTFLTVFPEVQELKGPPM